MIRLYLTLSAGLMAITAEACSCVTIIWTLASRRQPGLWLGLCLGGASLVPFVAQRAVPKLQVVMARFPSKILVYAAGFGTGCSFLLMISEDSEAVLYVTASLFALTYFVSSQAIEVLFSIAVLEKDVAADTASRMLQMVMTCGGSLGGLVAGTLIDQHGLPSAALASACCYAFAGLPMLCLAHAPSTQAGDTDIATTIKPNLAHAPSPEASELIWRSFAALIILAVSIGCFNVCLPYMATADRFWSATSFGIIDGCGGAGAFLALIAMADRKLSHKFTLVAPLVFLVAGVLLGLVKEAAMAGVCALVWGIAVNVLRTRARTVFFSIAQNVTQATTWTAHLVLSRVIAEAMAPVIAGLLMDVLAPTTGYLIMMGSCGVFTVLVGTRLYFRVPEGSKATVEGALAT